MQDPYSSMMSRDGQQFLKNYGSRANMQQMHSNYYSSMPYSPMASHTMSSASSDLHVQGLLSGVGGHSGGPSSVGHDYSSGSHTNGHDLLQAAHSHQSHSSHSSMDMHNKSMGVSDLMSPMPVPTSSPIPSSTIKHESDTSNERLELSSPSSSGSNPSTPLDLAGGDSGDSRMPPKKRAMQIPEGQKDGSYWEKRKKNNDSAKRSREARRIKEEQIALRVVFLEQENLQLRTEVSLLKSEIEKLRMMLYNP